MVRVAINGFGRIGRLAFRQMFDAEGYQVVAINDLTSPKMLAHLLKYDTAQGSYKYKDTVSSKEPIFEEDGKTVKVPGSITVNGKEITIYAKPKANELPWGELDVDVVLECTGFYTSKAKAMAHIEAGAKKVVISAPAGNDLPTVVYSVNENVLTKEDKVISAASCTTNCLAPDGQGPERYLSDRFRHHDHRACLHRRPDDSGRPAAQGRPASCPRRRAEHRSEQHRRCQGDRPGYSGAERQADRLCSARSGSDRFHHDPRGCREGQGCDR